MFKEVSPEEYPRIKQRTRDHFAIIDAVLEGLQEGKVYSDGKGSDLIIHKSAFSQVNSIEGDSGRLADFIVSSKELPEYFHVYEAGQDLIKACMDRNGSIAIRVRDRVRLRFDADRQGVVVPEPPAGYSVRKIDKNNFASLEIFDLGLENKFWSSRDHFLENGYGFCVFTAEGTPVSICYAAAVAGGVAEIDVATLEQYRKMGMARLTVGAFINFSLETGVTPGWDCFLENTASLQTATTLGFRETGRYVFLSIYNKNRKE